MTTPSSPTLSDTPSGSNKLYKLVSVIFVVVLSAFLLALAFVIGAASRDDDVNAARAQAAAHAATNPVPSELVYADQATICSADWTDSTMEWVTLTTSKHNTFNVTFDQFKDLSPLYVSDVLWVEKTDAKVTEISRMEHVSDPYACDMKGGGLTPALLFNSNSGGQPYPNYPTQQDFYDSPAPSYKAGGEVVCSMGGIYDNQWRLSTDSGDYPFTQGELSSAGVQVGDLVQVSHNGYDYDVIVLEPYFGTASCPN